MYRPKPGFFTIAIENTLDVDFHYSIELLTNSYRMVEFNEMIYDYVNPNQGIRYYELHVDTPGYIYMDTNACLADIKVYYEDQDLDSDEFKAVYPNENTKFSKVIKVAKAGPVFFKVVKPQLQRDSQENASSSTHEESYTSVYSLEFYYKRHYDSYPFKGVFPGNSGKIDFELGANPIVNFEPVVIREDLLEKYNYHLIYHLVMSPSEKEVIFRAGCDRLFEFMMPESYRAEVIEMTKDTNTNERGNFIVGNTHGGGENGGEGFDGKKVDGGGYEHQGEKEDEGKLEDLEQKAQAKKTARAMRDHAKGKDKAKKVTPKSDTGARRVLTESRSALAPFAKPVAKPDAPGPLHHIIQPLLNLVPTDMNGLQLKINSLISSCCTFNPKLKSGTIYYGKVYATLYASPKDSPVGAYTSHYIRIKYDEFSLRTPYLMLPFEYLFVGLVLLAIICSVCTIGKRFIKKMMSRVTGFRQVSNDSELDIDAKLEDYFMNNRGKFEEQFEEYKTYSNNEEIQPKIDETKANKEIKNTQNAVDKKSKFEAGKSSTTKEIELRTKTPVKTQVKAPVKTQVKAPVKTPVKAPVKTPVKGTEKIGDKPEPIGGK